MKLQSKKYMRAITAFVTLFLIILANTALAVEANSTLDGSPSLLLLAQAVDENPYSGGQQAWRYKFTKTQMAELQNAGCQFDMIDLQIANKLALRGFTAEQFVQAYKDMSRVAPGKREAIEELAVMRFVGVPVSQYSEYKYSGYALTDYYNSQIGGRGMKIAGWVLFGIGGGICLFSLVFLAPTAGADDAISGGVRATGFTFLGIGGVLALIGLPLAIVGTVKVSGWAMQGVLENEGVDGLRKYKITNASINSEIGGEEYLRYAEEGSKEKSRFNLSFTPIAYQDGGGMGFKLDF